MSQADTDSKPSNRKGFMKEGIRMKESKGTLKNAKDKIEGKMKEVTGEIVGNEQLELSGKLQIAKANIEQEMDFKHNIEEAKESIAKKINDNMDKKRK